MTKIELAKKATSLVVCAGTSRIVSGIISNNVAPGGIVTRVTVIAASIVIGAMASNAVREGSDKLIDDVVETWKKIKELPEAE